MDRDRLIDKQIDESLRLIGRFMLIYIYIYIYLQTINLHYIYIYIYIYIYNANFIKHNRYFMSTYFLLDPFEFPYYFIVFGGN